MRLIKKAGEIPARINLRMCIYSPTGVGKTTLACSAPKPLLIDTDAGAYRLHKAHQVDTVDATNYADVNSVLDTYDLSMYETVIFDTIGKLLDNIADYLRSVDDAYADGDGLSRKGYGALTAEFRKLCSHPTLDGKNIIFVGHRDNTGSHDKPYYEPLCIGKYFAKLATELDLVGYINMSGDKRILSFNPTDIFMGKNTCNFMPKMEIPLIVDGDNNLIADNIFLSEQVIKPYVERQNEFAIQKQDFDKLVESFSKKIISAKSVSEFNKIADLNQYNHIGSSKIKMMNIVISTAKTFGFTLNQKTKKYGTIKK